jgi:hypothetical protein
MPLEFTDSFEYSDDGRYRWWYERRWSDAPGLCWVGLNPSTGDTTGRPRPTLRKIVARADQLGLGAVTVVNLFSWRATKPQDLRAARHAGYDIVGSRTDDEIRRVADESAVTLLAWGSHGSLLDRGRDVARLVPNAMCLGRTRSGEPRHPLYVAADLAMEPFAAIASPGEASP